MQSMQQHNRHYIGPYSDGNDYHVFIYDSGDGFDTHIIQAHEVSFNMLKDADANFKIPAGAYSIIDEFVTNRRSVGTCDGEPGSDCETHHDRFFTFEVHRSRVARPEEMAARTAASQSRGLPAGDTPLAQLGGDAVAMENVGGGTPHSFVDIAPIPKFCSKNCPSGPTTIPCPPGTTKKCNPVTGQLYCSSGEG